MSRGLGICEAGIHGHGLASLEYPRYRHHAIAADREAVKVIGDDSSQAWCSPSTSTCSIRNGATARPAACSPRRSRSPQPARAGMHEFPMEFQQIAV